jgi:hypothetical protein
MSSLGAMHGKETAMIELRADQLQALDSPQQPPVAVDPRTGQTYVLVRKEAYERLKGHLALDDYDPDEGMALMNEVMAEDDAHDPLLESYEHFRQNRVVHVLGLYPTP